MMQDSTLTSHRDSRSTLLLSWFFLSVSLSASLVFTVSIIFSLFDHRIILTACSHCKGHQKVLCLDSVNSVCILALFSDQGNQDGESCRLYCIHRISKSNMEVLRYHTCLNSIISACCSTLISEFNAVSIMICVEPSRCQCQDKSDMWCPLAFNVASHSGVPSMAVWLLL